MKSELGYKWHTGLAEPIELKPSKVEHCRVVHIDFKILRFLANKGLLSAQNLAQSESLLLAF